MDVFGALADPVRRSLLAELAQRSRRVADLAHGRSISRPAVSKHLRLLLEAGVVVVEERGRERHYALDRTALAPVSAYLTGLTGLVGPAGARPLPEPALDALETEVRRTTRDRTTRARSSREGSSHDRTDRTGRTA